MRESNVSRLEFQPILCSILQASAMIGRGVSTIYELIGAGKIKAKKSDGRTLVVVQSLHDYAEGLPEVVVAPPRRRKPQHLRESASELR
jgi:hypothetical protein